MVVKHSLVTPFLKTASLDKEYLSNFLSIGHLVLSIFTERIVLELGSQSPPNFPVSLYKFGDFNENNDYLYYVCIISFYNYYNIFY